MKQNKIIAITGGIASGKSTAVEYLLEKGYPVVDSDIIAHDALDQEELMLLVMEEFGEEVIVSGKVDRKILGNIVFHSRERLAQLENIVYPYILSTIEKEAKAYQKDHPIVFVDIPLLIEKRDRINMNFDELWLVYATDFIQMDRLIYYRNLSVAEAKARMSMQIPMDDKVMYADRVLDNTKDKEHLYLEVERCLQEIGE